MTPLRTEDADLLLLTRLAVRLADDGPLPSDAWLRRRLQLFEQFCAPSVNAQTIAPTNWLLLVDEATPEWFVSGIVAAVKVPHEVVRLAQSWGPKAAAIAVAGRSSSRFLITSRLDSDDALGHRYVETVRAQFAGQDLAFVNLLQGAQWSGRTVARYSHPSNAFISCIERQNGSSLRTVFLDSHDRLGRHGPLLQVRGTEPMWLQVVHEGNLLNGESGWPVQPQEVLRHVTVAVTAHESSRLGLAGLRARAVGRLLVRVASRPSRLRWVPRYVIARVRRRDGQA